MAEGRISVTSRQGDGASGDAPGRGELIDPSFQTSPAAAGSILRGKRMTDEQLVALAQTCRIHDRFYIKDWAWDREDGRKAYFPTDYLAGLIEEVQEARRGE